MHATHPHAARPLVLALAAALLLALVLALAPRLGAIDLDGTPRSSAPAVTAPAATPAASPASERPAWVDGPLAAMERRSAWPQQAR
jgi:hypothetical protein